jgi:hypothetical protein
MPSRRARSVYCLVQGQSNTDRSAWAGSFWQRISGGGKSPSQIASLQRRGC